ncbi:MAG: 1-acyl-sn-glycerol-3-phosphate acyltransferase, partial [Gammaproteobacteria bacterium]|nr:1-acyl-sn-glycerol-3-phosphate acyltransferase [Gammaproteobacteria bacterium]
QSTWETMALQSLRPEIGWVLKKQLLRVPFFGWGIAMTRPVAIDRGSPRAAVEQVLRDGKRLLESGRSMAIFPEGTRISPGSRGRYNRSGAALAKAAGVPIIPVAHNAGEFWPRRRFSKTPGEIELIFGPAIDSSTMSAAELTQTAESWIEQEVARISGRPLALPENH